MSSLDNIFTEHKPTAEKLDQFKEVKSDIKDLMLELIGEVVPGIWTPENALRDELRQKVRAL